MTWTQEQLDEYNARDAARRLDKPLCEVFAAEQDGAREGDLHSAIIDFCNARGWLFFHGSMAHKTRRSLGEPDFTIIADRGRVFFVECKRKGGKRSPAQLGVAMKAESLGTTVYLVESFSGFIAVAMPATQPHDMPSHD